MAPAVSLPKKLPSVGRVGAGTDAGDFAGGCGGGGVGTSRGVSAARPPGGIGACASQTPVAMTSGCMKPARLYLRSGACGTPGA
jgi:hypothetical protein